MEELTGLDARFLYSETPTAHMHTIKVLVVDVDGRAEPLTPETLANALAERLDRMPGFRRRVVSARLPISHPVWIETPFEPADHIRWCRLDAPGDRVKLAAEVADIAGTPLRRDRPLWEIVVVQGLAEGKLAFVVKLHHALADGVAAAAMLLERVPGRCPARCDRVGPPGDGAFPWAPEPVRLAKPDPPGGSASWARGATSSDWSRSAASDTAVERIRRRCSRDADRASTCPCPIAGHSR